MQEDNTRSGEDLETNLNNTELKQDYGTQSLIEVPDIKNVIASGYYIDKTKHAYNLMKKSCAVFLSRPRRFGKSLFVSTLEEIAQGNQALFKDCWIGNSDYSWKKYPVIRLSFSTINNTTTEDLELGIKKALYRIAKRYKVDCKISNPQCDDSVQDYCIELVENLISLGNHYELQVVVLVDEYDAPFIINIQEDIYLKEKNREVVRNFLTVIKDLSGNGKIHLEFVTGVSAYCFKDCYSGPNNLEDLTLEPDYATIAGYEEIDLLAEHSAYKQRINYLATKKQLSPDIVIAHMRSKYNGYKFSTDPNAVTVYNPWSTLKFLKNGKLNNYWYESGTPSFLIQKSGISYLDIDFSKAIVTTESALISPRENQLGIIGRMFQAGYLTIDRYATSLAPGTLESDTLPLLVKFPNNEVKESFYDSLLGEIYKVMDESIKGKNYAIPEKISNTLSHLDIDGFIKVTKTFFSSIPYNLSQPHQNKNEAYYHTVLHSILECSGMDPKNEDYTNKGRIDIVVDSLPHVTYIFELKHGENAIVALDQIKSNSYREKFLHQGRSIVVIGINFSSKERNITKFKFECYDESGNSTTEDAIIAKHTTDRNRTPRGYR